MARQITQQAMEQTPSYREIEPAITFRYDYTKQCNPFTRDGYVSVAAIYNMASWSSWKSSSLGLREQAVASGIAGLPLHTLMQLNQGRRSNQPALFPAWLRGRYLGVQGPGRRG
jgi:hypothetical protein